MATNELDINDRIKIGKQNEARVLELLNKHRPVVCHTIFDKWVPASESDDKYNKIDAWAYSGINETARSVQIKYRETGGDLGIALIRPWEGDFNAFKRGYINGQVNWDRDFVSMPDFYVCLSGSTLMVVEGEKVKKGCNLMLQQFVKHGGFNGHNGFKHANYGGAELRLVKDRGAGYTEGQNKIICYLAPSFIRMAGGFITET